LNQAAQGVWFSLGTSAQVSSLSYGVSVSAAPLATQPVLTLSAAAVTGQDTTQYGDVPDANGNYVAGGFAAGFFASPAANFVGPSAGNSLQPGGASGLAGNQLPTLTNWFEDTCGAISAALALQKLGVMNADAAYSKLQPALYPGGSNGCIAGSWLTNFFNAKTTNFPGVTTTFTTSIADALAQANSGQAVEWWMEWVTPSGKTNAHLQFINSIQRFNNGDILQGVTPVSDGVSKLQDWYLQADGSWTGPIPGGGPFGESTANGFFIECPEPSAFALLGVGAIGLLACARRRRRAKA
jgi:hypothetical protein